MDNLDNLKNIWHTAKTDGLPTSKDMLQVIRRFRGQKLKSKWLVIISSGIISGLMALMLMVVPFKLFTTYLGGALITASCIWLAVTNIRSLKRFYELGDCSNREFMEFIEQTRRNQTYYYKKTTVILTALYGVGALLYFYEFTNHHTAWLVGVYTAIIIYLAIMFFIVRPRTFKKDAEKLNATRQRLKNISEQLK